MTNYNLGNAHFRAYLADTDEYIDHHMTEEELQEEWDFFITLK